MSHVCKRDWGMELGMKTSSHWGEFPLILEEKGIQEQCLRSKFLSFQQWLSEDKWPTILQWIITKQTHSDLHGAVSLAHTDSLCSTSQHNVQESNYLLCKSSLGAQLMPSGHHYQTAVCHGFSHGDVFIQKLPRTPWFLAAGLPDLPCEASCYWCLVRAAFGFRGKWFII